MKSLFFILDLNQENCLGGCPCDNYPCFETTTSPGVTTQTAPQTTTSPAVSTSTVPQTTTSPVANAVLVLSTFEYANRPMIIDFDGKSSEGLL